jgi:peptidoglycan LD-endopeptidase CwlK
MGVVRGHGSTAHLWPLPIQSVGPCPAECKAKPLVKRGRPVSHQGVLIGVFLYFALACGLLSLVFLPSARVALQRVWQRSRAGGRRAQAQATGWTSQHAQQATRGSRSAALGLGAWLRAYGLWLALGLLAVVGTPLLVLSLGSVGRGTQVSGYDHTASRAIDANVAALLQGEQLVPPEPLPPELFVSREIEQVRPLLKFASREWALLDGDFRQRLLLAFKMMREQYGYELVLLEGFRSPERQTQLAQMGGAVTQARAYESYHQYGMAADVAFLRDRRIVISERDPWAMRGYEKFGAVAQQLNLTWGGSWRSLQDFGHVELRRAAGPKPRADNTAGAKTDPQAKP